MKKLLALSIILIFALFALAEEAAVPKSKWKKAAKLNANLANQIFDNWTAGGDNSLTWNLKFNGSIAHDSPVLNWKNNCKVEYGQTKLGKGDFLKSLDELFLETVLSYKITSLLSPYATATLQTQMTKAYSYETSPKTTKSTLMDPGYLTQGLGMGIKPSDNFSSRLGFSIKETFSAKYGYADDSETITEIEKLRVEPGLESVNEYSIKCKEILVFNSKLQLFANFKGFNEIDTKWENLLTVQFSKYLNVNIGFDLLYDRNLSVKRQIKQGTSIGLNYSIL